METAIAFKFQRVSWQSAANDIMEIRKKVFVIEQRFPKEVVCDQFDNSSYHLLVTDAEDTPVGCGRLIPNGRVGKIAVLINHRGHGVGTQILNHLINIAQENNIQNLTLNAETDLVHFYDQQQFHIDGPVYMKKGVPFHRMTKKLA
ncbi:GNAT family N-acetyltransferase [Aliikangiella maris]|uniref:GNAT family N-acetyltransferase n=2 Tax=Aliikangiella maris TaxID=3162458 RepID=A0ABV2BP80_9GAMM